MTSMKSMRRERSKKNEDKKRNTTDTLQNTILKATKQITAQNQRQKQQRQNNATYQNKHNRDKGRRTEK